MALFSRKQKTQAKPETKPEDKKDVHTETTAGASGTNLAHILRNPRITEKASMHMSMGVYAFDVDSAATKQSIAHAVYLLYSVRPRAIRVVTIPRKMKRNSRTGKRGMTGGGKKAYVYLKKGESITLT